MVSFNSIPEEDFSDDDFDEVFGSPQDDAQNQVEIQLAYEISFSVDEGDINMLDEHHFLEAVDDAIKPSDKQFEFPYGKNISFYSICAPENFDKPTKTFNFYVHFRVDEEWCYCGVDRNNRINFFHSLKDDAIQQTSPYFMVGNVKVNIENIKLSNITYPLENNPDAEIDFEDF